MNIEYLIEPKLKDRDKKISELKNMLNAPEFQILKSTINIVECNRINTGLKTHEHQYCLIKRAHGTYRVTVSVETIE